MVHDLVQQMVIGAAHHAVLRHVGDDIARAPLGIETINRLPQITTIASPATCRKRVTANVERNGDLIAVFANDTSTPVWVLQRRSADVDAGRTCRKGSLERLVIANATGQLHLEIEAANDASEELGIRPATEGSIQIHEVNPLRALTRPSRRRLSWVAIGSLGARGSLYEANSHPIGYIDSREQDEGHGYSLGVGLRGAQTRPKANTHTTGAITMHPTSTPARAPHADTKGHNRTCMATITPAAAARRRRLRRARMLLPFHRSTQRRGASATFRVVSRRLACRFSLARSFFARALAVTCAVSRSARR